MASVRTEPLMGTLVSMQVVGEHASSAEAAIDRAFDWFREIEERCTRFDARSELMQLTRRAGVAVPVSAILYEAVRFALVVAEESGGAFDPTVGHRMEGRGFNRNHRTGTLVSTPIEPDEDVSFRDVSLDSRRRTITLRRPLMLDLGAVAKGLAVDMAARELEAFRNFAIDAGGDLYFGGVNTQGDAWRVGIRHPGEDNELIDTLRVSDQAVCTSGDYERRCPSGGHHILDPRSMATANAVASVTVVASGAMLADALATAAFVLGPQAGLDFLGRMGVAGLIITPELKCCETRGLRRAA